jgi:2-keto-4-pentenoate hydratase
MASELAKRLWEARLTGAAVDPATVPLPTTAAEAYAIQWEIVALSGLPTVGFKIGSTSLEAQRLLGTDEPGSAALMAPFVHASPATVEVSPLHGGAVEGEIAFRLATPLPARAAPYVRDEVAAAVGAVAGAIELVGTRFAGGLAGKGRLLTTADGGVNIALVTGPWQTDWRHLDLPAHPVRMLVNGERKGHGTGSRALGDPMNVLVWLANQQSKAGRGLPAGAIVSTGTCTGLDPVAPGDVAVAEFGSLGRVELILRQKPA